MSGPGVHWFRSHGKRIYAGSRVRPDARESAMLTFRWLRKCGYSRRICYQEVAAHYGWGTGLGCELGGTCLLKRGYR